MCPQKKQRETEAETVETVATQHLIEAARTQHALSSTIEQLHAEVENLKHDLKNAKTTFGTRTAYKICIAFTAPGASALIFSILHDSPILAFIGLGLTFWGALFLFIRPVDYVKSNLLNSSATSQYSTIDKITKDLECQSKSYYIPPYPKEIYLPEHLKGLKETIAFIPAKNNTAMPSLDEIAEGKFLFKNQKGFSITPPGLGFADQIEKNLRTDPTKMNLESLCETLPQIILENLQLAKEIQMTPNTNQVHLKIEDSAHKDLYSQENLKSIHYLGCPIVSAIACEIAKTTGKIVTIQSLQTTPETQTLEATLQILEA